ncbi:MAG: pyruvate carboxylase subunit A [Ignavibacteria bacterium GWA2_35_9]|nr:MAG: pyruvate carboxylase subunit A [Ignavibacteria bacterium GWA2_35_9]OGU51470.1 MAG: pyruvate carboxylase subunit A [Ignavibacteria bacterium GWC2_36_12]
MFKKILIANRGEIAVRIIRACKDMGIISAAVYSEADKHSLHTILADEVYSIGESQASSSYLNKEKIINLAKEIKARAIHPGYGFFSENSYFIKAVEDEGIVFIGPSSKSVALMGKKTDARRLMMKNKVPVVPGTTEPVNNTDEGIHFSKQIGFPVLLKASAGGGGKGMRKITSAKEFGSAFEATKREALKAFGNDEVYIEKYIESPRHIEVQVLADKYGNYVHVYERECSIQRRHQKIIEEAPSVFVDDKTRKKITTAAISAAKACGYYNAGTIEFLMDKNKNFYFLEMNTRLQVEHPVTELITGIDLVKEQILIAAGNKLSFSQKDIKVRGHAIESRIYAEDPLNDFLPSTGEIIEYIKPAGPGVRIDDGFMTGSKISLYYDPLISKLICYSSDRNSVIERMLRALAEYHIAGPVTNIPFLLEIFKHKDFIKNNFDINFVERKFLNKKSQNPERISTEKIPAIFSAILKKQSTLSEKILSDGNNSDSNKWMDLLNE